jgi:hypothetical protein
MSPGTQHANPTPPRALRPHWVFTFYVGRELRQRAYHVSRESDAWQMFHGDEPQAYGVMAVFEEIPL